EEDSAYRCMGVHEGALGIEPHAVEVATNGLGIPRRKRGQQVRSMQPFDGMDDAAHDQRISGRGLHAGYPICSAVDRSATGVRLGWPSVTILQDSVAGSHP